MAHEHDLQIIANPDGGYIRSVCRSCGAGLDLPEAEQFTEDELVEALAADEAAEPGPIEASLGDHAIAEYVIDDSLTPEVIEGLLYGSTPHTDA